MYDRDKESYLAAKAIEEAIQHLRNGTTVDEAFDEPLRIACALFNEVQNIRVRV